MSRAPTRRGLLTGSAAAALGLAASVAPALAVVVPKRGDTPSVDAALIELAGRVSRLAGRLTTARTRSERLMERVEGLHPKPSLPVSNGVFHAYQAEIRPTEDRVGLTRLRKVNFRSTERLDRWSSDLAAMASGTAAGLAAKASAVLQFDDLSSDSEAAEMLALSVLHDAVRLGGGAHA